MKKKISITPDEEEYLRDVLFIDMLHLNHTKEDTTIPEQLLKKIQA